MAMMGPILFVVGMGCLLAWGAMEQRARPFLFFDLSAEIRKVAEALATGLTKAMNDLADAARGAAQAFNEYARAYGGH
jgi:hypothetical protein